MSQYYLTRNGQTIGPFSLEELPRYHLTAQDMVWKEGFENWVPAGQVSEISEGLKLQPFAPTQAAYSGVQRSTQSSYTPPQPVRPQPVNPTAGLHSRAKRQIGLLVMGIFGIILSLVQLVAGIGFLIGGIAMQDRSSYYSDNYYALRDAGQGMTVSGGILLFLGLFFLVFSIVAVVTASQKRVKV